MNEEELNKIIGSKLKYVREKGQAFSEIDLDSVEDCIEEGFQKGKLEERERIKRIIIKLREGFGAGKIWSFDEFEEQLQKEIGGMK